MLRDCWSSEHTACDTGGYETTTSVGMNPKYTRRYIWSVTFYIHVLFEMEKMMYLEHGCYPSSIRHRILTTSATYFPYRTA